MITTPCRGPKASGQGRAVLNPKGEALWTALGIISWAVFSAADLAPSPPPPGKGSALGEGPRERAGREGRGSRPRVLPTHSPGTVAVVPYFAVVDGLAAQGVPGMDIGTILHQHLHTAQQALAGCQVEGCAATACLPVDSPAGQEEGRKEGQRQMGHLPIREVGRPASGPALPLVRWVTLTCPFFPLSFNFLNHRRRVE